MTLNEKQFRFTYLVSLLIQFAYAKGFTLSFGDAYAHDGHKMGSFHYKRLAVDLNLFKDGKYLDKTEDHRPLGKFWETLDEDCTWGGNFSNVSDGNHYSFGEH